MVRFSGYDFDSLDTDVIEEAYRQAEARGEMKHTDTGDVSFHAEPAGESR